MLNGKSLIDDQKYILNQIANIISKNGVDALIIAGDIYDKAIPSTEAIEVLNNFLNEIINESGVKVLLISGNHDSYERLSFGKGLFKDKLYIANDYNEGIDMLSIENIAFYLIPFEHYSRIRLKTRNDNVKSYDSAYQEILSSLEVDNNKINICVAHGYFVNGEIDSESSESERRLSVGNTGHTNIEHFNMFDICMFGHLHNPQKIKNESFRYSGSILKYSFSEIKSKSVCLFNIEDKNKIEHEFVELKPRRDLVQIEGEIDTLLSADFCKNYNLEDYFKIKLLKAVENPLAKLSQVYKNIIEIESPILERIKTQKIIDIEKKETYQLFEEFYKQFNNEDIEEDTIKFIKDLNNKVYKESE